MTTETDRADRGETRQAASLCHGCGHARYNHVNGTGLCIVKSCRLCLIYTPSDA